MRPYLCAFVIMLACGGAAAAAPPRAHAAIVNCTVSAPDVALDAEEKAFLTLINNHRAQNGRAPLTASYKLSKSAQWKSHDMGANNYFAHDDANRSWVQRIRDCGYGYNAWLGENIAAGISSAQSAFDLWKNSPGHNENMLNANYTAIGIGRAYVAGSPYGWYWTNEFASVSDGWATTTAAPPTSDAASSDVALELTVRRCDGALHLRAVAARGAIERVEFYVDGALVRSDRRASFTATWRGPGAPADVRVVGYDRHGSIVHSVQLVRSVSIRSE